MELAVNKREVVGKKVRFKRREGGIPGVVYGKYIDAPVSLIFDKQEFLKLYKKTGSSTPLTLKGDGVDQLVLVHDLQVDPVTSELLHVDFLTLKKGEKIKTVVPVIMEGLAPVEKLGEGKVQLVKDELEIEAMPKDLPHDIKVVVSGLETTHDVIFVKDLTMPKGVVVVDDMELPVVTVLALVEDSGEESDVEINPAGEEPVEEAKEESAE